MTQEITKTVFRQYQQVQESGQTNMVMKSQVRQVAMSMGLTELCECINSGNYTTILENYGELADKYE